MSRNERVLQDSGGLTEATEAGRQESGFPGLLREDMKYEVMTFDAMEMFQYTYEKNNHHVRKKAMEFNLNSPLVKKRILMETREREDNAMFYQIRECLKQRAAKDTSGAFRTEMTGLPAGRTEEPAPGQDDAEAGADHEFGPDCLKFRIVFVDFSRIYSKSEKLDPGYHLNLLTGDEKHRASRKEVLRILFKKGMKLTFAQKDAEGREHTLERTFVPFDKNASMSRSSRISFIDRDFLVSRPEAGVAGLDERVRVGIDFRKMNIEMVNSKYLAYRGLLMSDGTRMEHPELVLNEKTVIVLPSGSIKDYVTGAEYVQMVPAEHNLKPFDFITVVPKAGEEEKGVFDFEIRKVTVPDDHAAGPGEQDGGSEGTEPADNKELLNNPDAEEARRLSDRARKVTAFDGEGMISPEYSLLLNECLKHETGNIKLKKATSFQIRMPFTKGMLHEVDFHKFLKEQILVVTGAGRADRRIYDAFGIQRDLSAVRIVLTESMFKAAKWLQKKDGEGHYLAGEDPMKVYFEKFHEYSHALYVSQTDLSYARSTARLSYQFLNTLCLSEEEMKRLVDGHVCAAGNIVETKTAECREGRNRKVQEAWEYAIASNPAFLHDPYIENMLKSERSSMLRDVGLGRLQVSGCQRYLSVDLLSFLLNMAGCLVMSPEDLSRVQNQIRKLKRKTLQDYRFYLPGADSLKAELSSDEYYGVLRSPHLSRNEECALMPYLPEKRGDRKNLYTRYFSHLRGLVMISYSSSAALILGGADCDGDLVQVIWDKTVNDAILRGAYESYETSCGIQGPGRRPVRMYRRRLPIAVILPEQSKACQLAAFDTEEYYSNLFDTIHDTFAGNAGIISNAAIRLGMKTYAGEGTGSVRTRDSCADNRMDIYGVTQHGLPDDEGREIAAYKGPVFADDISGEDRCAVCTILAGLDIDAAKNGRRPNLSAWLRENSEDEEKKPGMEASALPTAGAQDDGTREMDQTAADYFLDVKDTLDGLSSNYIIGSLRVKTQKTSENRTVGYNRYGRSSLFEPILQIRGPQESPELSGIAVLPLWMTEALPDYKDKEVSIFDTGASDTGEAAERGHAVRKSGGTGRNSRAAGADLYSQNAETAVCLRFRFEEEGRDTESAWKGKIENTDGEKRLKEFQKVLETYKRYRSFRSDVRSAREELEKAHFIRNIYFILKVEYDPEFDRFGISGQNYVSAVEVTYAMLKQICVRREVTGQMLERLVEERWAFVEGNDHREDVLYRILGAGEDESERAAFDACYPGMRIAKRLFLNRSEYGFWILFYMLKDLETGQKNEMVSRDQKKAVNRQTTDVGRYDVVLLNRLMDEFIEGEEEKKPVTGRINQLLMERVRNIYGQDMSVTLRALVYLCDAGNTLSSESTAKLADEFLWQVFAEDHTGAPNLPVEKGCGYYALLHEMRQEREGKDKEAERPEHAG